MTDELDELLQELDGGPTDRKKYGLWLSADLVTKFRKRISPKKLSRVLEAWMAKQLRADPPPKGRKGG